MSIRTERVASVIKEEIGALLAREYRDPGYGFITVTDVRMSPDLKIAKVSFSILGNEDIRQRTMKMLEEKRNRMRGVIGSRLHLRYTPSLQFYLDDTMERADRINILLRKIHEDEQKSRHSSEE